MLRGLVLGSGSSGVLLTPGTGESLCAWLPLARQLADDGYQVLLHQVRAEVVPRGEYRYGLDVMGAARELHRRDVTSIVAAGAGTGATAVAATAEKISGLKALVLLTPLAVTRQGTELDAVAGARAVDVPTFVAAAQNDVMVGEAREVAGAASDSRLEIVPGAVAGVALTANSAMRDEVRAFVREVMPPRTFLERWTLPIGGVVLLALVVAGVVVLRGRNTTTPPDVSAGS
ncbi:hypothetical protein [Lentzea flaviverrucosa]|uniref:Alpha/beta hydrolase n=1 Tax=Lentzea flaviverrucosa TaxID=200379 RepID=A0A1H9ULG2_9PSEU|nr:hypothetical protein [Lentzea flaviverrucosa]RDI27850.1 hypothetical protein DFR72_106338 [Lentzea flaviverrucosa]SES10141.1 hypothetical protein SAMN05216195_1097 [Lentzea flaviverrucosa]